MARQLMKGNEAIAEGAIRAGCQAYFGYPITPQNEVLEYMARRMPELGRVFIQAESELAAINMVMGAVCTGTRAMTSTSGPGFSLMQEAMSTLAAMELPAVVANVMRAGPGVAGILPAQGDYLQATKGGGHGDYRLLVLAPATVPELMDLTALAFNLADKYRNPCLVLADGLLGQSMEPVELHDYEIETFDKSWAVKGSPPEDHHIIHTNVWDAMLGETRCLNFKKKYLRMAEEDTRYEEYMTDDAEYLVVAYGSSGRVAQYAVVLARSKGIKVGLLRPITLFPFPKERLLKLAGQVKSMLVVEMSVGQMVEDVEWSVRGQVPVELLCHAGGVVPKGDEVLTRIEGMGA